MCKVSQVVGWMLELCPMMSHVGQSRHFGRRQTTSGLPPGTDIVRPTRHVRKVPCVDGSGLARAFSRFAALVGAAMCSAF
jgi:hypothetical protein